MIKKILFAMFTLALSVNLYAQNITFTVTHEKYAMFDNGSWGEWTSLNNTSVITFQRPTTKIIIKSRKTYVFSIVSTTKKGVDRDGNQYTEYRAIDDLNKKCDIRLINKGDGKYELFVLYDKDMMMIYY